MRSAPFELKPIDGTRSWLKSASPFQICLTWPISQRADHLCQADLAVCQPQSRRRKTNKKQISINRCYVSFVSLWLCGNYVFVHEYSLLVWYAWNSNHDSCPSVCYVLLFAFNITVYVCCFVRWQTDSNSFWSDADRQASAGMLNKDTVDGRQKMPPLTGPPKGINIRIQYVVLYCFVDNVGIYITDFWLFP